MAAIFFFFFFFFFLGGGVESALVPVVDLRQTGRTAMPWENKYSTVKPLILNAPNPQI